MAKERNLFPISLLDQLHTNGAGYDLLRYLGLHELLGQEADTLLYFMGRNLARKLDIKTMDDIIYSFERLGFGRLELVKEKKQELTFYLMSDAVVYKLKAPFKTEFRLESGFLAESIQKVMQKECECIEKVNQNIHQIQFQVIFTTP